MSGITIPAATAYNPAHQDLCQLVALPAFSDNYIWMVAQNNHVVVVDPGQAGPVLQVIERYKLTLDAILLTHHHHDHVGGVNELVTSTQAPVYGPANERLPICDHPLREGDGLSFPNLGLTLRTLDVPGHTAGHIAYHGTLGPDELILFCGDTLFAGGCGRVFEGTPAQMYRSLSKLAALPPNTLVCCGHEYTLSNLAWAREVEPDNAILQARWQTASQWRKQGKITLPSRMQDELDTNPFLRCTDETVALAAAAYAGRAAIDPTEVFAQLREWKNNS